MTTIRGVRKHYRTTETDRPGTLPLNSVGLEKKKGRPGRLKNRKRPRGRKLDRPRVERATVRFYKSCGFIDTKTVGM